MENVVLFFIGGLGSMGTYFVNTRLKQGPVRSSALLSLVVALFVKVFPHLFSEYLGANIPAVFIGSSFIGMVSARQLSTYLGIALAGILFTAIFINTSFFFKGYGGSIGTTACIAVLVVLGIPYIGSKTGLTIGLMQLQNMMTKSKRRHVRMHRVIHHRKKLRK